MCDVQNCTFSFKKLVILICRSKHCKYFKRGRGNCPFEGACFYKHQYEDGRIAQLPAPSKNRRRATQINLRPFIFLDVCIFIRIFSRFYIFSIYRKLLILMMIIYHHRILIFSIWTMTTMMMMFGIIIVDLVKIYEWQSTKFNHYDIVIKSFLS